MIGYWFFVKKWNMKQPVLMQACGKQVGQKRMRLIVDVYYHVRREGTITGFICVRISGVW